LQQVLQATLLQAALLQRTLLQAALLPQPLQQLQHLRLQCGPDLRLRWLIATKVSFNGPTAHTTAAAVERVTIKLKPPVMNRGLVCFSGLVFLEPAKPSGKQPC